MKDFDDLKDFAGKLRKIKKELILQEELLKIRLLKWIKHNPGAEFKPKGYDYIYYIKGVEDDDIVLSWSGKTVVVSIEDFLAYYDIIE